MGDALAPAAQSQTVDHGGQPAFAGESVTKSVQTTLNAEQKAITVIFGKGHRPFIPRKEPLMQSRAKALLQGFLRRSQGIFCFRGTEPFRG
ncbi:MAG TPA: hypothetical protein DEQ20_00920 [Desulfobulbaceae bacterium]|nr:MAG: hypothetical protein A2520_06140 [Deltaproteobacteria bacterium RIFOXYD12_FULL_53_23]HCC53479.1 hypothetical protein [Desulfobulbaceae bacterium]